MPWKSWIFFPHQLLIVLAKDWTSSSDVSHGLLLMDFQPPIESKTIDISHIKMNQMELEIYAIPFSTPTTHGKMKVLHLQYMSHNHVITITPKK